MDGFTDNFVPNPNVDEVDPAAEFLAREQNELAGLDDDIAMPPVILNTNEEVATNQSPVPNSCEMTNGPVADEVDTDLDLDRRQASTPSPVPVREEPEKIKLWREEQKKRLEEKDAKEEVTKEELREKAKKELEEWYKQHEEQVTKTRQANRSAEKELVADTSKMEPGTEWERIAKLCDFNPKTAKSSRDISRMRSIILKVKQNPPAKA